MSTTTEQLIELSKKLDAANQKIERITGVTEKRKNKWDAILYAAWLGGFGVHHFYVGNKRAGYAYLALCWTLIPFFLGWIQAVEWLFTPRRVFESENLGEPWSPDPTPDTHVICPDCRDFVKKAAVKCPHCGVKLIAQ